MSKPPQEYHSSTPQSTPSVTPIPKLISNLISYLKLFLSYGFLPYTRYNHLYSLSLSLFFFLQQHFYSFPLVFQHLTLLPSKITYPHHSLGITPQLHIFYIWPFLPLYSVSRSLSYYTTALLSSSILHYFAVMPCGLYYASTLLLPTFFYFYTSPLCCYAVIVKGSVLRYYF